MKKRGFRKIFIDSNLEDDVKEIIKTVETQGDSALIEFTKKFDNVNLNAGNIKISDKEILNAYKKVHKKDVNALKQLKKRIEKIEQHKLKHMKYTIKESGLTISHTIRPIESVGCYIPGGEAVYPSTVLMTVTPAKVAGIPRIVVCSPPTDQGEIDPLILVATSICGVDEVYRVGGAQAIAALAYGTESIRPVVKIVGPGNRFVTSAKIIVSKDVAIDIPAGPSEIVILADETANSKFIALDLISQSEHASDNTSGLVTTSRELATKVIQEIETRVPRLERGEIVTKALSKNGFIFIYDNMDKAISFVNSFAPEHLEIITHKPLEITKKITSAGIIFIGNYTPVTAGDYCIGTNHVIPTSGFAQTYSELSIFDYVKRINVVNCSKERLFKMKNLAETLATREKLPNHSAAIEGRFRDV